METLKKGGGGESFLFPDTPYTPGTMSEMMQNEAMTEEEFLYRLNTLFKAPAPETKNPEAKLYYPDLTPEGKAFADAAEARLRAFFAGLPNKQDPDDNMWAGLREIISIYAGQIYGGIEQKFYLSSLATGLGKSSALVECVKLHVSKPELRDVGAVIFIEQLHQIDKIVRDMELTEDRYACLTMNDAENGPRLNTLGLGRDKAGEAQILFTTQRRLENLSKDGRAFKDIDAFFFRGKPRPVKAWDEAVLPSAVFTITEQGIDGICNELDRRKYNDLYRALKDWAHEAGKMEDGITAPPDVADYGIASEEQWLGFFTKHRKEAADFWELSGKNCRVRSDPFNGGVTLSYKDILPDDLAPVLVLDASGEIRHTYELWKEQRKNLVKLHSPPKFYKGLTVHICNEGAGKNTQQKKDKKSGLIDLAVTALNTLDDSRPTPLMVSYKYEKRQQIDWEKELREKVYRTVAFTHYGRHTALNDYASAKDIFIMGMYEYPHAVYEGMVRGVMQANIEDEISPEKFERLKAQEIAHNFFQAVGRGAIRYCVGNQCPDDIHVYVVCKYKGVGASVPETIFEDTFQGCTPVDWPMDKELKGRPREALDIILDSLTTAETMRLATVRNIMGMDKSNFDKDVLKNDGFKREMKARDIVIEGNGGRIGNWFKYAPR